MKKSEDSKFKKTEDFITEEELEGVIAEVRKDVKKIEDKLNALTSTLASSDMLQVAEKILQFVLENPEQLSKKELREIAEEAVRIGKMGKKIKNINT